ncbi:MAG: PhnD/SsuA/transferrin family substrate-binding protein, partial [Aquabacterium sp.]|nr:PhnD/SsuA/transferrin family substrate-binding protein [Aquabacterium sp.]
MNCTRIVIRVIACAAWLASAAAQAGIITVIAGEPTSKRDALRVSREAVGSQLERATGEAVNVVYSEDLTDVMRATRTGEHDVYIAPPQVAASALSRGFELVGSTDEQEQFVLVARSGMGSVSVLKGRNLYLPQQDSIYTYMARGLLNAAGLSMRDMKVEHARYPAAGLVALGLGMSDATVVRHSEWLAWSKDNPKAGTLLATSSPVPGGLSVVVKKSLPQPVRERMARWFNTPGGNSGLKPVALRADLTQYRTVAVLGHFTPTLLPGATIVTAPEVRQLVAQGA